MVVTGIDENNILVAINVLQAKLLVEAVRRLPIEVCIEASNKVNEQGFEFLGIDVMAAALAFSSVMKLYTDTIRVKSKEELEKLKNDSKIQPANDEETLKPKEEKETIQ